MSSRVVMSVVAAASAIRFHSNALLSACVKENVPQTDQKRITISHVACTYLN